MYQCECPNDKLYHLSASSNLQSIIKYGLKWNSSGKIWLFDHLCLHPKIAVCQIHTDDYIVLEVDKVGIKRELELDPLPLRIARHQWSVKQYSIEPKYLHNVGRFTPTLNELLELNERIYKAYGMTQSEATNKRNGSLVSTSSTSRARPNAINKILFPLP